MSKRKRTEKFTISDFYCTCCGKKGICIARRPDQQRGPGHLKKLYCLNCKKETNHVEIRPFGSYQKEDFEEEYNLGRFVNGERVPIKDLLKCTRKNCEYNRDGRCWNATYSYDCGFRKMRKKDG